jgi:hypothetical protein
MDLTLYLALLLLPVVDLAQETITLQEVVVLAAAAGPLRPVQKLVLRAIPHPFRRRKETMEAAVLIATALVVVVELVQ